MALPIDIFLTASAGFKTALLDDKNERKIFVEIDFEQTSSFIDVTEFIEKVDIGSQLRSEIGGFTGATSNTAKITFRNDELSDSSRPFSTGFFSAFNASTFHFNGVGVSNPGGGGFSSSLKIGNLRAGRKVKIKATVGDGNETITIFTGTVDKAGFVEGLTGTQTTVDISLHDRSKDLIDTKAVTKSALSSYTTDDDELIFINLKVCDSADVANSLVHRIAEIGGVVAGDIISEDILNVVSFVKLTKNVWPELVEIAEAYNALVYFDGDDKLRFVRSQFNLDVIANDTFPPSVVEHTWDKDNTNKINKGHIDVFANKVQVSGKIKQAAATKEIIYNFIDDQTYNTQTKQSAFVIPSSAAPTQPDIANTGVDFFAQFKTENDEKIDLAIDIDTQSQAQLLSEFDALSFATYVAFANKVNIRLSNVLLSNAKLLNIIIRGKPVRNIRDFNIFEIDQPSIDAHDEKLITINNKYFDNEVTAGSLAAFVRDFGSQTRQKFTLNVPAVLHMQAGAWIKLVLDDTTISDDVDIYCRVEGYKHNFVKHGLQTSTVELVAYIFDWNDSTTDKPKIFSDSLSTNFRSEELRKNPFADDDPIPILTGTELWDFAQRTTSSLGRRPTSEKVEFFNPNDNTGNNEFQLTRTNYRGAIGLFDLTGLNEVSLPNDLTFTTFPGLWVIVAGSTALAANIQHRHFNFTRLTRPATAAGTLTGVEQILDSGNALSGTYSAQMLMKRGTLTADSILKIIDTSLAVTRLELRFNWTTEVITQTTGKGEIIKIDDDTFLMKGSTGTAMVGTSAHKVQVFDLNETTAKTWFVTALQVEKSAFPTPWHLNSRRRPELVYKNYLNWDDLTGIEFWIRPFFNFDTATDKVYFTDKVSGTEHIVFFYDASIDKFSVVLFDGTNTSTVSAGSDGGTYATATAFLSDVDLHKDIHIKIVWDIANDILNLRINGGGIGSDITAINSPPFNDVIVFGHDGVSGFTKYCNSYIWDFICIKNINTLGDLDRHFDLNRPWYNPAEIAGDDGQTSSGGETSDVLSGDTNLFDKFGRRIQVGESKGIQASDTDGNIIHDLPNAALALDTLYVGHMFLLNNVAKAFTVSRTTVGGASGSPTDHDISAFVSSEITNISAVWVRLKMRVFGQVGAGFDIVHGIQRFGSVFGALPASEVENICCELKIDDIDLTATNFCIIPVTRDSNGIPHITERLEMVVAGVPATGVDVDFIIMGFLT